MYDPLQPSTYTAELKLWVAQVSQLTDWDDFLKYFHAKYSELITYDEPHWNSILSDYVTERRHIKRPDLAVLWYHKVRIPYEMSLLRSSPKSKEPTLYFVTLAPRPDCNVRHFINTVNDHWGKSVLSKGSKWVFEQKGETEQDMGRHTHCHILFKRPGPELTPSKLLQRLEWALQFCAPQCIDIKERPMADWEDKVDYITGKKWDDGKQAAVAMDPLWRSSLGLKQIYP